ncbi:MAG: hypothetical protein IPG80_03355 [Anaerolineales bacterium]|nr:hypothetical protein [Anaerolineales bacterium]
MRSRRSRTLQRSSSLAPRSRTLPFTTPTDRAPPGSRVGDTVVLTKAGDIIPKIMSVVTKLRTGKEQAQ